MKLFNAVSELLKAILSFVLLIFAIVIMALGFTLSVPFILMAGLLQESEETKNDKDLEA